MKSAEQWVKAHAPDPYTTRYSKVLLSEDDILEIQIDALKEAQKHADNEDWGGIDKLIIRLEAMAPK